MQRPEFGDRFDIFVGNVRDTVTEAQLEAAFSMCGKVKRVRIQCELDTGRPRGFAFVGAFPKRDSLRVDAVPLP